MTGNTQHRVNAAAIEPAAVASWPARETLLLDGWLLRFSEGYSSRANSVSPLDYGGTSLDDSIDAVEAAYHARGLPPLFQITPACRPADLEAALIARGYVPKSPTVVMVGEARAIAADTDLAILSQPSNDFMRLTREGAHSPADGDERLATLARAADPKAYVVADGVACGASVAVGDWAGIYVMRTASAARRKGHGTRVLRTLAAWALCQGADGLYLQVDEANAAGRALYARAGLRDGYRVLHYRRP